MPKFSWYYPERRHLTWGETRRQGKWRFGRHPLGTAHVSGDGLRPGLFRIAISGRAGRVLLGLAVAALDGGGGVLWTWRVADV